MSRNSKKPPSTLSDKPSKVKPVRDSFTMPRDDYALIEVLKNRALGFKRPTKKSELLRAGLQVLSQLTSTELKNALNALAPVKTGRPKAKEVLTTPPPPKRPAATPAASPTKAAKTAKTQVVRPTTPPSGPVAPVVAAKPTKKHPRDNAPPVAATSGVNAPRTRAASA